MSAKNLWRWGIALLCLLGIFLFTLLTPLGLRYSLSLAAKFTPGLQYQRVSGTLMGPILMHGLQYQEENKKISIQQLKMHWNPLTLLWGKVTITKLEAQHIRVTLGTTKQATVFLIKELQLKNSVFSNHFSIQATATLSQPFSAKAQLRIAGSFAQYTLQLHLRNPQQHLNWRLSGEGNTQGIHLHIPPQKTLGGSLSASAYMQWKPALHWNLHMQAQHLRFNTLNPHWPHQLSIQLHTQGDIIQEKPHFSLTATLSAPQAKIHLVAEQKDTLQVQWSAAIAKLSALLPQAQGTLYSRGKWTGTLAHPVTQGTIQANHIALYGYRAENMEGHWQVDLQKTDPKKPHERAPQSHIQFTASQLLIKSLHIASLHIQGHGWEKSHYLSGKINTDQAHFAFQAQGGFLGKQWAGVFKQATITARKNTRWYLVKPAALSLSATQIKFPNFCWRSATSVHPLCFNGQWNNHKTWSLTVKGQQINLQLLADLFFPNLVLSNTTNIDMKIWNDDTLQHPKIKGSITLHNGKITLPHLGITLTQVNLQISTRGPTIQYQISAFSKERPIHITGITKHTPQGLKSNFTLRAKQILIMNTPEYVLYATPNLQLDILGSQMHLQGDITIPSGLIQPRSFTNVVSLPEDQIVYVGKPTEQKNNALPLFTKVTITLGKAVKIHSNGLSAKVTGQVTVIREPQKPILANGHISVSSGKYVVYGKTLSIQPGSFIQFVNSPLANPSLNIRAIRKIAVSGLTASQQLGVNDITVGILLTGTAKHPKIQLFSIPSTLSQADVLSYLVLGYAGVASNSGNIGLLLEAASSLQLGGKGAGSGGGVVSQIKQGLNLSELGIESQTLLDAIGNPIEQQSAFVIGKHLTPRIYMRYSLGLGQGPFAPVSTFQIRYLLGKNWMLQTNSSTLDTGFDIVYMHNV